MRRSTVLGIGLFVPLFLMLLLLSSVLSLAATSPGEVAVLVPDYGTGTEFSETQSSLAASFAPEGAPWNAHDSDVLWGRESAQGDRQDAQYPTWLTNLPPRPRTEASPPVPAQLSAEQPSFLRFEWTEQVPHRAPQASTAPVNQPNLNSVPQATPVMALPLTIDASESSPAASESIEASTIITLALVHRGTDSDALSSTFVFTNTSGSAVANCVVDFYWPNDQIIWSDVQFLDAGQSMVYFMDSAPFAEGTFVGYVVISSDQLIEGRIVTPDYGWISGMVVEDDGSTPLQINNVSVQRASDGAGYGEIYSMADGRFYVGGLPDDNYVLYATPYYPWASQWYDGRTSRDQADPITISGAGETPIVLTMQPGGRITGTVFASDGVTRLENVNVDIEQGGYGVCTDANGEFIIELLPYGDYKVRAGGVDPSSAWTVPSIVPPSSRVKAIFWNVSVLSLRESTVAPSESPLSS